MKIQFLGATGTVTGSKYLVTTGATQVLIDCGLFQGYKQLRLRNWSRLPVDPAHIDAVILTHAHIDHSGYLPLLVKNGFRGPVYCSHGTRDLCKILLPDSGYLQEEEAKYANRKGFSKHKPALPLYTRSDAEHALRSIKVLDFDRVMHVGNALTFRLSFSGHILGSSFISLSAAGRTIVFSGDLGRLNDPIMAAPSVMVDGDYLVMESTYGDRRHPSEDPGQGLTDIFNRTFARGGVVVIPAFAVGRAQMLLYHVNKLKAEGKLAASVPVYLNSPMAANVTEIFRHHPGELRLTRPQCEAMCNAATVVSSAEESEQLNRKSGPMIIVSANGMATGGRVVHHLKAFAPDARNTILFVGYQAGGTRGAAMLAGAPEVKIHGSYVPVRAEIANLSTLSAHADYEEILKWLGSFKSRPCKTFITHGDPTPADALRVRIAERLGWDCHVPDYLETVELE